MYNCTPPHSTCHAALPTKSGTRVPTSCTQGMGCKVHRKAYKTVQTLYKKLEGNDIWARGYRRLHLLIPSHSIQRDNVFSYSGELLHSCWCHSGWITPYTRFIPAGYRYPVWMGYRWVPQWVPALTACPSPFPSPWGQRHYLLEAALGNEVG
eukprot:5253252-Amphidinium_carterae.1